MAMENGAGVGTGKGQVRSRSIDDEMAIWLAISALRGIAGVVSSSVEHLGDAMAEILERELERGPEV